MKKILSMILALMMLLSFVPSTVFAEPSQLALEFGGPSDGVYLLFDSLAVASTNGTVSFDLSMAEYDGEGPEFNIFGSVIFTKTSISVNGSSNSYNWGSFDVKHWRKVDVEFASGSINVYIDGQPAATGNGSFGGAFYFLAPRGHIFLDNLSVVSAGIEIEFFDFEDEGLYLRYKNSDSSVTRGTVPAGSYYDYSPVIVPDDVSYIFNNVNECAKLKVQSGVEMKRGDINEDNKLNTRDVSLLKRILTNDNTITFRSDLADVNGDGKINSKDTARIKKIMAGDAEVLYVSLSSSTGSAVYSAEMQSALLTAGSTTAEGIDASLVMDSTINAEDYTYAVITYMVPDSTENHNSAVASKSAFGAWGNLKNYDLTVDGTFHSEIVDLSDISTWNGDSATLKFFTACNEGDKLYVDSIIFCANISKANSAKAVREAAKANYKITDQPDPSGKIGYLDEDGNYCIVFDEKAKVDSNVTVVNNTRVTFSDNAIKATATGSGDPGYYIDLVGEEISASNYKYITYVYKNPNSNKSGKQANIYYVVSGINEPTGGYETPLFGGKRSDSYNMEVIDLSSKSNWTGDIKGLRIDYFADTTSGDVSYLDSIIFSRTSNLANKAGTVRLRARNGSDASTTADIWNTYWKYYQNLNNYEYITGSATNLAMYFRYGSESKLTARSLQERFARAITNATGLEVTCKLYSYSFCELDWSDSNPQANMYYTLYYEGDAYLVYVKTYIIKDGGYSDPLDGTSADPVLTYKNTSTWATSGYSITDSKACTSFNTYVAAHSNHEIKLVETPYGSFAVHHVEGDTDGGNVEGGGRFSVFRIYDNGTSKTLGTYDCTCHTTKPQIMYGDDGLVYFIEADDSEGTATAHISLGYFDPSQPNADGSYNITYSRTARAYPGGPDPSGGGYGYSAPVLDPVSGNIYIYYCGGRDDPGFYLCWFTYNYRQHKWSGGGNTVFWDHYRHCYLYGYPDRAGGVYLVTERACLLECLGLKGIVYGADYAWDQITMFHIGANGSARAQIVIPADYTQIEREMYPGCMNANSDVFITSDKKLHVIWHCGMHARSHHVGINTYLMHCIYDVSAPGAEPELIYKEPIAFASPDNYYSVRFVENTSGHLFILAMPGNKNARCEVWRATDTLGTQYELMACRNFSNTKPNTTALMVGNNRNNSVVDNTITCMYPTDANKFMHFTVTLPAN